jgi:hypothetical protein
MTAPDKAALLLRLSKMRHRRRGGQGRLGALPPSRGRRPSSVPSSPPILGPLFKATAPVHDARRPGGGSGRAAHTRQDCGQASSERAVEQAAVQGQVWPVMWPAGALRRNVPAGGPSGRTPAFGLKPMAVARPATTVLGIIRLAASGRNAEMFVRHRNNYRD